MTKENKKYTFEAAQADITTGVDAKMQKSQALDEAKLPVDELRTLTAAVAGRLMANQSLRPAEKTDASNYIEAIFQTLDGVDEPDKHPNEFKKGSIGAMMQEVHYGEGKPQPALGHSGIPLETTPGVIGTVNFLQTAKRAALKASGVDPDAVQGAPISQIPGYQGRHWVEEELANTYAEHNPGHRLAVPELTPAEMPQHDIIDPRG